MFPLCKNVFGAKKTSFRTFFCFSQKKVANRILIELVWLLPSFETFIPTELLVLTQMSHTASFIHPWWYYFIKFQLSFFEKNDKIMEKDIFSEKDFRYKLMNLITTHVSQQLDSRNYLSSFYWWLKLLFRIKFKLLNKLSIDDTLTYLLEVYFAVTSTISYLDSVLNWNYQKQLLLF